MNNDPTPMSSAAGGPLGADADNENDNTASHLRSGGNAQRRAPAPALRRELRMMNDLLHSLDLVVAAELCTLYYLDCSFFFLVIRGLAQTFFMSPKSDEFIHLMPAHRPHVFAIFGPNILCFLLHAFVQLPQGSEAARGYLHGGVIVDFIGQKAPTSKLSLLAMDLLVLALQCFMLAVHTEANKLRKALRPGDSGSTTNATSSAAPAPTVEDLDAEERGISRTSRGAEADDIELQPLNPRGRPPGEDQDEDGQQLGESSQRAAVPDLSEVLWSGNAVLADFHVIHTLRTAGNDPRSAAAHTIQTLGYAATLARLAAENRATREAQRGRPLGP